MQPSQQAHIALRPFSPHPHGCCVLRPPLQSAVTRRVTCSPPPTLLVLEASTAQLTWLLLVRDLGEFPACGFVGSSTARGERSDDCAFISQRS